MPKHLSPSKKRNRAKSNCKRKIKHASAEEAQLAIIDTAMHGRLSGLDVEPYQCDICGFWHWGRVPSSFQVAA